jgi:hypothetical protein
LRFVVNLAFPSAFGDVVQVLIAQMQRTYALFAAVFGILENCVSQIFLRSQGAVVVIIS